MAASPIIERFQRAGQGHVFAFFDQLNPQEQQRLLDEAAEIDLGETGRLTETLLKKSAATGINLTGLEPAPYVPLPEHGGDASEWAAAKASGEDALRAGRV